MDLENLNIELYRLENELQILRLERMCAKARTGELLKMQYVVNKELEQRGIK